MFLTLYYIAATYLQSWRIKSICTKITEKLTLPSSVAFYSIPLEGNESTLATSELCTNRSQARISDILWLRGNQRGCSIMPVQHLHLGPWVSFPEPPNLIPFEFSSPNIDIELDENNLVHLLLETDIVPNADSEDDNIVMIENYGKPIAWKVDSHFAILLQSDINYFTKLIMSTFMQDNFTINDRLPLIRIESVHCDGTSQPFDLLKNHLRKQLISRAMRHLSSTEWEKHLSGLRSLSVFANQATEFEYNKNRTEGKTGVVKPDLIPSKNVEDIDSHNLSPEKKPISKQSPLKIEANVSPVRQVDPKSTQNDSESLVKPPKTPEKLDSITKINASIKNETVLKSPEISKSNLKSVDKGNVSILADTQISSNSIAQKTDLNLNVSSKPLETISTSSDYAKRPNLVRNKGSLTACKPPNVLVFSESTTIRDSVISMLKNILEKDTYTVYPLTFQQVQQKIWIDNTTLLVICGSVEAEVGKCLLEYFLRGGKILSLCSDVIHMVLPTYRTAEVREHELVQFSYDKWQKVKMMHHIFCYQPSPVKKHFSSEGDDLNPVLTKKPALVCPRSVEMKDLQGDLHNLDVKVLGTEETWNTPSILRANNVKSGGKAVFSQVHLEADPGQFESDEAKYAVLKKSDKARLEILADILEKHLDTTVRKLLEKNDTKMNYQSGYFLGRHEAKFGLLEKLKPNMEADKVIKTKEISIQFCGKGEIPPAANRNLLPILVHSCPEDFSTVDYFDNLHSKEIGRLVIYVPLITSSMHIIKDLTLTHGIAVIPRQQSNGSGRNSNQWLSPEGCGMFSLQLHFPLESFLGQRISLLQHLIAIAIVHGITSIDGYENIDIRLKWPNDIYANGVSKIGGLIINTQINQTTAVCNIGVGLNLNNSYPTLCLNDLVRDYNKNHNKNLSPLRYEKVLAIIFTEIEKLIDDVQSSGINRLYEFYYQYWLHSGQDITILDKSGKEKKADIIGIDEFGYLKVKMSSGQIESVHPDGNSFDMLKGLILPK